MLWYMYINHEHSDSISLLVSFLKEKKKQKTNHMVLIDVNP